MPQGGTITKLNIVKTGFFIFLKGPKSSGVFANFCYGFYRDDFYIFIPAKPLKVGFNKSNVLEGVIPKLSLYRSKDRYRSVVSTGVTIGNNGFKDFNSWKSIERGPRVPEDRPCEPVESQEVIVGLDEALISGLDLETSRGTARERPCMFVELRDVEETNDTCRNPRGYNVLL